MNNEQLEHALDIAYYFGVLEEKSNEGTRIEFFIMKRPKKALTDAEESGALTYPPVKKKADHLRTYIAEAS